MRIRGHIIKNINILFFIILFSWLSFLPQQILQKYQIAMWIFSALFLLLLIADNRVRVQLFSFKDWPLWVFLFCLFAGTVAATDKSAAYNTYIYLALTFALLFYIGKAALVSTKNVDAICIIICSCSLFVATLGIIEVVFRFNPIYEYLIYNPYYDRYIKGCVRAMSTQMNPAPLATYLLLTVPFGMYLFRKDAPAKRLLGLITFILSVVCLVLTFSRGSLLGLICALFFYEAIQKQYRKAFIILSIFVVLMVVFSFLPYPFNKYGPKGILFYESGILNEYRLVRMRIAQQMLIDHPFVGIGLNNFRILFDKYSLIKTVNLHEFKVADNMYIMLLAEAGIVGFIGFVILIFTSLKRALKLFSKITDQNRKYFLLSVSVALIGFLPSAGGYDIFYWHAPYMFFSLICGFIWSDGFDISDNN